ARKRNLSFSITLDNIWKLFIKQNGKCAMSGIKLILGKTLSSEYTASLDRIDSTKGYHIENVQWVHKRLNFMKSDTPEKDFFEWVYRINQNQTDKLLQNLNFNQNKIFYVTPDTELITKESMSQFSQNS